VNDLVGMIVFALTMPIWVPTFFIWYGLRVGKRLAEMLIKETWDNP
jgi:hypothetical protein